MKDKEIIMNYICAPGTEDYKCYDTLIALIDNNESFKKVILDGIKEDKIHGFSTDLWEKLDKQKLRAPNVNSFVEVFADGSNQGYCTVCAKQVSYSLNTCYLCGGVLPILEGTVNCPDGSHTWIEVDGKIIDTTLMLVIDKDLKNDFGYIEENRYDPNKDSVYNAAKEFANDTSLRKR